MWGIILNRQSEMPLKRQIYQSLRDQIINGRFEAGETLPSTRELAKYLNISRNTVCEAYEMLLAEGFILNRQGAPTRVAQGVYVEKAPSLRSQKDPISAPILSADFRTGQPDLRHFPQYLWQQTILKTSRDIPLNQLGYTGPKGLPRLREEISAWLFRSRGLTVEAQDVFITAGATHALHLIANLLCKERQDILIEDPCHSGMLQTFLNKGCSILPIPVDAEGLQIDCLSGKQAGAIYVTPSHQFPLGGILPAARRVSLIRFAREHGVFIIEDDYDSEFRYGGEPIAPLYAMDSQQVIYVGTFSKVLFPALRIGYVLLPRQLHTRWRDLRTHTDVQNPLFEQAALAELLSARKLDRHIRRMRKIYGERRRILLKTLEEAFGNIWRVWGDSAGLHLAVEFPGKCFDDTFLQDCVRNGIGLTTVESHCIQKGRHLDKLLLGYGHLEPEEIRKGILFLSDLMKYIL